MLRHLVGRRRGAPLVLLAFATFSEELSPPRRAALQRTYSGDATRPQLFSSVEVEKQQPLHPSSSLATHHHPPHAPSKDILNLITSGDGCLDDMEASLDCLGIEPTPSLLAQTIASCRGGGAAASSRRLLRFFSWCRRHIQDQFSDDIFNQAIRFLAETKDLTAMAIAISDLQSENRRMDPDTFGLAAETFVRSNRPDDALRLFRQCFRRQDGNTNPMIMSIVHALCEKGHAEEAERIFRRNKDKILVAPASGVVHRILLHGWCVHGNAREARRIMNEMEALSIPLGLASYHDFLRCICKRNLRFNPSALVLEATDVMTEMKRSRFPPTAMSFNILLSCLCRTRRVKEACRILAAMVGGEAGCSPDWVSYYLVARVLYLTGRFGRGHEVVEEMIGAAVPVAAGFYHGLVGVLCGMEEVGHALKVFECMLRWRGEDAGPTYDLLIEKVCRNGEFEMGRRLWDEAAERGVGLRCSSDLLDPSKVEVFKIVKVGRKTTNKKCNEIVQRRKKVAVCLKGNTRKK